MSDDTPETFTLAPDEVLPATLAIYSGHMMTEEGQFMPSVILRVSFDDKTHPSTCFVYAPDDIEKLVKDLARAMAHSMMALLELQQPQGNA